jgi:hypothetical protein
LIADVIRDITSAGTPRLFSLDVAFRFVSCRLDNASIMPFIAYSGGLEKSCIAKRIDSAKNAISSAGFVSSSSKSEADCISEIRDAASVIGMVFMDDAQRLSCEIRG